MIIWGENIPDNKNKLECKRCGHTWNNRVKNPKQCPSCGSFYWDREPQTGGREDSNSNPVTTALSDKLIEILEDVLAESEEYQTKSGFIRESTKEKLKSELPYNDDRRKDLRNL